MHCNSSYNAVVKYIFLLFGINFVVEYLITFLPYYFIIIIIFFIITIIIMFIFLV